MGDREGSNGLPFVSEHDARLPDLVNGVPAIAQVYSIRLASGVEAQLIQAEAELAAGDANWLTRVNQLRTSCTDVATCATPAPAGTGGVVGLAPLTDPGADDARLDLLFRERAYWMYLTGHRQGDLRRLVRNYHRPQETVYPTGAYVTDRGSLAYGADVAFSVLNDERKLNTLYHGCVNRDA
jgi:hypothetical protein